MALLARRNSQFTRPNVVTDPVVAAPGMETRGGHCSPLEAEIDISQSMRGHWGGTSVMAALAPRLQSWGNRPPDFNHGGTGPQTFLTKSSL